MKVLVLGIGNPILGDDGIGFHIAQALADKIKDENIDVKFTSVNGLNLLELIMGYDRLIAIDAIMTGRARVGEIFRLRLGDIEALKCNTASAHYLDLATGIDIGKVLFPSQMPQEVEIFAVGIQPVVSVTEEMTAEVAQTIPRVVSLVLEQIGSKQIGLR